MRRPCRDALVRLPYCSTTLAARRTTGPRMQTPSCPATPSLVRVLSTNDRGASHSHKRGRRPGMLVSMTSEFGLGPSPSSSIRPARRMHRPDHGPMVSGICNSDEGTRPGRVARTVITEQGARRRTPSATLPISSRPRPVRPCVPITIRSLPSSSAAQDLRGGVALPHQGLDRELEVRPVEPATHLVQGLPVDRGVRRHHDHPRRGDLVRGHMEEDQAGTVVARDGAGHPEGIRGAVREVRGVER